MIFKHLLPRSRSWNLTANKRLREFFEGLTVSLIDTTRQFCERIWADLDPYQTRELVLWEAQFDLRAANLTESQRRNRLSAVWKASGGQSPSYIQDTLRNNGFDVYVYEWWYPADQPPVGVKTCVAPINPFLWLRPSQIITKYQVTCGNPAATCGNPAATCGSTLEPIGYPLVNKIFESNPQYQVTCGNPAATCGNPAATCGNYISLIDTRKNYIIPSDPSKWPYFLYIGGEVFGALGRIEAARREEFELLCLKICPSHLWLGLLVKYE